MSFLTACRLLTLARSMSNFMLTWFLEKPQKETN